MRLWPRSISRRNPLANLVRWLLSAILSLLLGARVRLPQHIDRVESYALQDTAGTRLGKAARGSAAAYPGKSGFHLLARGLDAFVARAMLALGAERSIDAQYYLLHNDLAGNLFLDLLLDAADRGVRVRLLVDDMTLDDRRDVGAVQLDAHPNIQVRVFNPFGREVTRWLQYLSRFGDVTRRMHNKSFTVDNAVTVVGGRNIGNEYFDADPNLLFGDLDVLAVGPVVDEVSSVFDLFWNSEISFPVANLIRHESTPADLAEARQRLEDHLQRHRESAYLKALHENRMIDLIRDWRFDFDWGSARTLYDHPDKIKSARDRDDLNLTSQLETYANRIETDLYIISPYFVPGRKGVERLLEMRGRGVRVRILTNSLASTDVAVVHAGYARYRRALLRAGVELYELDARLTRRERRARKGPHRFSRGSLHAKSFILDRKHVFIGSMNFDPRSVVENTEIGMLIDSPEIARKIRRWFELIAHRGAFRLGLATAWHGREQIVWHGDGEAVRYTTEPNAGFWRRFGAGFLRYFPLESQL
jgi:putative cardiolipin synthase